MPGRNLEQSHGVEEDRTVEVQATKVAIQAPNGVGRMHDLPNGLGELEHWTDVVPACHTKTVHAAEILGFSCDPSLVQTGSGGLLIRNMVDRLQVIGEGLLVFVRYITLACCHYMHDAPRVFHQGICRRYGVLDAAQSICVDYEYVMSVAIFRRVQHIQPELRTFVLADRDA